MKSIGNVRTVSVLVVGTVLAVALAGAAQARESRPRGGNDGEEAHGGRPGERMARYLGIDTGTAQQLAELMQTAREAREEKAKEIREEMQDLKQLLDDEASARRIDAQLDRLAELRDEMHETQKRNQQEIRRLLGPEASARLLIEMSNRRRNESGNESRRPGRRR